MKVSIVVPIYNAEKYLEKCIESIINQSFKDFELILVNDGSTDKSLNVCNKYKNRDSRIRVIDKENEGSILTRRRGVNLAEGKYLMFSDADDYVEKESLKKMVDEAEKHDLDIVIGNNCQFLDRFSIIKRNYIYFKENKIIVGDKIRTDIASAYLHGDPFPASLFGKLYKSELIKKSGKYLKNIEFFGDDLYLNLEVFLKAKKIKIITDNVYNYRYGGNTSRYMSYMFSDVVNGYKIQKEVIEEFYQDSREKRYGGISILLLKFLKACIENCFAGKLPKREIESSILKYLSDENIIEASKNKDSIKCFTKEFIGAIKDKDIGYFYEKINGEYKKKFLFRKLKYIVSKL
ncbi:MULTISPECIES: glycosyltransferase family 2 protein [Psychrilyobacter]|uniref:Glycosyltransferase n=1 Tax=Psychrilyobacter piezotolerans TaxID=2293438 RepID=A0ABX9KHQ3_9FUSO|nr:MULTISPECIES: glycosyltransferase [Psychrilyobacter]NDI77670.1 glycosyltransferase [Psychrilyobacter piezotolerans]RDE62677.1 glycosyltransferase [Psychrilyobacter sp. S5]REI41607.1 glycosyltransferase [Psychrilyobacter piezotolerans]